MTMTETPLPDEAAPLPDEVAPTPPPKRGLLAVLVGVVAWPRSTFTYLRDHGGRSWLVPLGLALVLTLASRLVAQPIEKAQAEAAQAALQAQIDALQNSNGGGSEGGGVFISGVVGAGPGGLGGLGGLGAVPVDSPLATYGLPLLGVLGEWLLRGGALLALAWVLGGRPKAGGMFRMSGWTFVPDLARLVVTLAVMLALGRIPLRGLSSFATGGPGGGGGSPTVSFSTGDGGLVNDDGTVTIDGGDTATVGSQDFVVGGPGGAPPFLLFLQSALFSSLDVYLLWSLVLLAIGVAVTARLGWLKAGLATLLYFVTSLVLTAVPSLLTFYLMQFSGPGQLLP